MIMKKIAITSGDPAGIGPEIVAKACRFYRFQSNLIYIIYGKLIPFKDGNTMKVIKNADEAQDSQVLYWLKIDNEKIKPGQPGKNSGKIALQILQKCAEDLNNKKIHAVVTCPVSKHEIRKSAPDFIGHTEFFARSSNSANVIMSFWGPFFNLALLTTHLPVCEVSEVITRTNLIRKLKLIYKSAEKLLKNPEIAMLALNPHAGEKGAFGSEDELIASVLQELEKANIHIAGPFPSDTFFSSRATEYDLVISAYHDQGLIPFKMISSENGVNVTLGLPYVRTSVDHGTAFDIAGLNIASEQSLIKAIEMAEKLILPKVEIQAGTYSLFAKYYDQYMGHVEYENWAKFLLQQYNKKNRKNPRNILELACGTANISSLLVKSKLKVDASDISPEMLKIAAQKPFAPELYCKDMLSPIKKESYDLVILLFDSINYLTKKAQISSLFSNVAQGLRDHGLFIFDISTINNCKENFDGFINLEDNKSQYLIHQSELNYDDMIQTTYLTFFEMNGFLYKRGDEIHKQKIYKTKEIVALIKKSPLNLKGIFAIDNTENLINQDTDYLDRDIPRLFFVLEKDAVQ
jgi:4-hydroxythreonine-4-phosphate dehydrogenase